MERKKPVNKKKVLLIIGIAVVAVIAVCIGVRFAMLEKDYRAAAKAAEAGDAVSAYETYEELGDYRDSAERKTSMQKKYLQMKLQNAVYGDEVSFGKYEKHDTQDGADPITWIVLKKENDEVLLISKDGLDSQPYTNKGVSTTWETSYIRNWLNDTFYNAAFSDEEKEMIVLSDVKAGVNEGYHTDAGNDTQDYVFFLSVEEAEDYFPDEEARLCTATKYAETCKGAHIDKDNGYTWWWLRSPGFVQYYAVVVDSKGVVCKGALSGYYINETVRPVIRISLKD